MQDAPADQKKPCVLVVEDEPVMNELVAEILRFHGFEVRGVFNGEDALEACRAPGAAAPDAVVLDLMLPGISGYEVCHQLKCARATNLLPVVMLTALDRRDDRMRGIRVGADAYLTKPFAPELLIDTLLETLEQVRCRAARGVKGRLELSFEGDLAYLKEVNGLLGGLFAQSPLAEEEIQQVRYCLLEIGQNAAEWSRRQGRACLTHMEYTLTEEELVFRIREEAGGPNRAAQTAGSTTAPPPQAPATVAAQGEAQPPTTFVGQKLGLRQGDFDVLLSPQFMDDIRWSPDGAEVTLTKRFKKPA